jgi:hypothetical protein
VTVSDDGLELRRGGAAAASLLLAGSPRTARWDGVPALPAQYERLGFARIGFFKVGDGPGGILALTP